MTTRDTAGREVRPRATHALLAAALLAVTALVRVPTELYRASAQDFASASRDLLLALFAAGLLALRPAGAGRRAPPRAAPGVRRPAARRLAAYAWIRSGFFPGPSVNLDGSRITADLSTGPAGLFVPLAGAALLAWLGTRQPRVVTTLLAVLLAGSLAQSLGAAASAWGGTRRSARDAVTSTLEWSRNGNVLILVLDSLQSDVFADVLEAEPRLRDELDGFRYYRLASSNGPTTYLSLPTIHGGGPYEPGKTMAEYYRAAVYEGSVLNRLAKAGYRTSYAVGVGSCPKAVASCVSMLELARSRVEVTAREASELLDIGDLPRRARRTARGDPAAWPGPAGRDRGAGGRGAGAVVCRGAHAARLGLDRDRLASHRQDHPLDAHPSPGGAAARLLHRREKERSGRRPAPGTLCAHPHRRPARAASGPGGVRRLEHRGAR